MKLGKRLADLVRAVVLASPGRSAPSETPAGHDNQEVQLEQIGRSLATAEGRRQQLQDELAAAEQAGRVRDALRLRRNLEEMSRSTEHLQGMLEVIESRLEAAHQVRQAHAGGPASASSSPVRQAPDSVPLESGTAQDADLEARKRRLSRAG